MTLQVIFSFCHQLLPGIPDEITFGEMIPKLPWKAFYVLSLVSHHWRNTIQSRKIYDARDSTNSTEMLIVIQHEMHGGANAFSLYSLRDHAFYELPGIPQFNYRIPESSQFVSLNGKIYALGGYFGREVYVLDVAGQRPWKQCASMLQSTKTTSVVMFHEEFACGVMDGKIYVFSDPISAVYDPKEDVWYYTKPMLSMRVEHRVIAMGEEMLIHGGYIVQQEDFSDVPHFAETMEFYNPIKDEWRVAGAFVIEPLEKLLFVANGKLYVVCFEDIFVVDMGDMSWKHIQSWTHQDSNLTEVYPLTDYLVYPCAIVTVNNELLATFEWLVCETGESEDSDTDTNDTEISDIRSYLFQTKGFGSEKKEIVCEKVRCPLHNPTFMCSIQL